MGNSTALLSWDSAAPGSILSGSFVAGLQSNETIVGIDFRPATGELYALGTSSRLYTLNTANGNATAVGAPFAPPLNGFNFGFDFNPTIDRIRVVAETNKNTVLNPITGAVQLSATDLAFGPADPNFGVDPNVVSSAYSNNFVGAATTQLYGIDTALDILVTQANNAGTLGYRRSRWASTPRRSAGSISRERPALPMRRCSRPAVRSRACTRSTWRPAPRRTWGRSTAALSSPPFRSCPRSPNLERSPWPAWPSPRFRWSAVASRSKGSTYLALLDSLRGCATSASSSEK